MKPLLRTSLSTATAALALAAGLLPTTPAHAQTPNAVPVPFISTFAGLAAGSGNVQCPATQDIPNNAGTHTGDGCLPTQAVLTAIYGAFTDTAGNVYITENGANTDIRVIYRGGAVLSQLLQAANPALTAPPIVGRIYTLAGSIGAALVNKNAAGKYGCNGTASGASALDANGNGCPAAQAYLKPRGAYIDTNGNVFFVTNSPGYNMRVIYSGGTQVANLIIAENPTVTAPQVGYVYKIAGLSSVSYSGDGGLASAAGLIVTRDVVGDSNGNIYISDGTSSPTSGNTIRVVYGGGVAPVGITNPTLGYIYTFAGGLGCTPGTTTTSCPAGDSADGTPARSSLLNGPYTMAVDRFNNVYIAEYLGNRVRVVYNGGTIPGLAGPLTAGSLYTFAGSAATTATTTDNTSNTAVIFGGIVQSVGVDTAGNIYVEDYTSKRLWRFDGLTGNGFVIAGRTSGSAPTAGVSCSGTGTTPPLSTDNLGDGCPAPQGAIIDSGRISFDPAGNIFVGENSNGVVRRLSYNNIFANTNVATTATQPLAYKATTALTLTSDSITQQGSTTSEFTDAGTGTCAATATLAAAQICVFNINFTPSHDGLRTAVFQLNPSAGIAPQFLSGVGVAAETAIDPGTQVAAGTNLKPTGIAVDLLGNVFVADSKGNQLLKGSTTGTTLNTFATGLKSPAQVAVDSFGNIYVADTGNNRVAAFTPSGTLIGSVGSGLAAPQGVAIDALGDVFIADTGNNRVVEVTPNGVQSVPVTLTGLAAPTQITFDSSGSLYIIDAGNNRIVELPANGNQFTFTNVGTTRPSAIAVDPAGTVYVTDATTLQIESFAVGSSTSFQPLVSGLVNPVSLATDLDGNLYLADAGVATATYFRRQFGNITFPITNVNSSSTSPITLSNVGNANFNFPTTTLYTRTGSAQFTAAPASTNGCGTGITYAPGSQCSFAATFAPTARGASSASFAFNTTAANAATNTASLTGNGQQLVATTSTISVSPAGTVNYGQQVTVTATVTPASNAGAPTGTVTFTVDNKAQAAQPYGTGTYTLVLTPGVGSHSVSVAFSGDGIYASSAASTTFIVAKANTTTTLNIASQNNGGIISLVFTATVASPTATGASGTVAFYAGTQLLGTTVVSTTTGKATYTSSTLSFPTNSFTAVYSGDNNFASSTSAAVVPTSDFAIGSTANTLTIPQGGIGYMTYSIAALYGATGTVTASCSGLPANTLCRFVPQTITIGGNSSLTVQVYTNVDPTLAMNAPKPIAPFERSAPIAFALLPLGWLLLRKRSRAARNLGLLAVLLVASLATITGCGSGSPAAKQSQGLITPTGTSTVTVTLSASPLPTHTTTFTLTIIPNTTPF